MLRHKWIFDTNECVKRERANILILFQLKQIHSANGLAGSCADSLMVKVKLMIETILEREKKIVEKLKRQNYKSNLLKEFTNQLLSCLGIFALFEQFQIIAELKMMSLQNNLFFALFFGQIQKIFYRWQNWWTLVL